MNAAATRIWVSPGPGRAPFADEPLPRIELPPRREVTRVLAALYGAQVETRPSNDERERHRARRRAERGSDAASIVGLALLALTAFLVVTALIAP